MNRRLLLLLAVLLAGTSAPAKTKPTPPPPPVPSFQPAYFFNIDLDPRYQIVGIGALTPEAAATANCYYFTYGADGKIRRIEYRQAGIPAPDPFFKVPRIDFEYQPGKEIRWYRDDKGQPVSDVDGIQGEELTLNAGGFPTDVYNLNASKSHTRDVTGVIHYIRTLDDKGRVVSARRTGLLGTEINDKNGFFERRIVYDDQSRPIECSNYDSSGNLLNDNDGVAITRTTYTLYPDSTQMVESYFDASGQAVGEKSTGVHQRQRTVDKRGFLLSEAYFDVDGSPILDLDHGVHEERYEYDERGNKQSESCFGVDGQLRNQKTSDYARVVFRHDNRNRVSERAFFGDDGTSQIALDVGAAIVRLEYDDQGNVTRRQFFDGKGNPVQSVKYGAPAIRLKTEGDTTFVSLRNDEDKPMKNAVGGFFSFSYKTGQEPELSPKNRYYDSHGRPLGSFRVFVINPHLHALRTTTIMRRSARYGAGAAGLGALLAGILALRKASHTKRRKVYIPTPLERFLGWFSIFAILEGTLRFIITIYWAWVGYQNGLMGPGVYILETIFIVFFLYRLFRLRVTMRVLNINRDDIHRLIRDFFREANLDPKWDEEHHSFVSDLMSVRVLYSPAKYHAYLSFYNLERPELMQDLARRLRAQVGAIQGPQRTQAIAFYYPSVAVAYFLLSGTAFYTLCQLLKG